MGRVLPLFDGLQEVAPAVRAAVLERLDAYPGPFVLTAETHAYRQAAAGGRPQASAVIELGQLRIGELDNYRRTAGAAEAAPGDSGARTDDQAGAGREDGNEERTSRQYTSNQLFAVYGPDDPYSPDQARRWFTFLARGLERAHRYDIRWHNVPALVRPAPAAVIGALLAAGAFEVTLWPGYALCERLAPGFPGDLRRAMDVTFDASTFGLGGVASPLAVGGHLRWLALVAVIGALMWVGGTRPGKAKPKRTAGRRIGDRRSAGQGARKGLVWGVYLGGVELLTYWLRWPEDSWRIFDEMLARHGTRLSGGVVVSFLLVLIVVAVAVGAVAGALRRETGAAVEPSVEHPDAGRRTGLRVLLGSVAVFAVLWPPYVLMLELYYEMPSRPGLGVAAVTGAVFGAGAGLLFTATALSWSQFAVARLYLAARGRLPLHLLRFLDDARDRQLLTGADGIYGYRDPAFRDRLVVRG
ncbi:hypothetical protein [Dactylosporangium sp. NPDC051541]|uniref:hypothetical protein n=1 Tax=Dactylosporangium sp. NPDC051541 TaxID=3363977 RepID=UPI0037AB22DD